MSIDAGFPNAGPLVDVAAISVTDSSAASHTVSSGKSNVLFQNVGTSPVWMGGSTVDPDNTRGYQILPKAGYAWPSVKSNFKAYFKCATGDSSTISVVEG